MINKEMKQKILNFQMETIPYHYYIIWNSLNKQFLCIFFHPSKVTIYTEANDNKHTEMVVMVTEIKTRVLFLLS